MAEQNPMDEVTDKSFVFSDELLYIPAISESRLCAYMPGFYVICIHGGQIHPRTLMTRRAWLMWPVGVCCALLM